MNRRRFCSALFSMAMGSSCLGAELPKGANADANETLDTLMNLLTQTAGGKQFWADVWFFHDWRIQCHALTSHYRLLDGANHRVLSGTYEQCRDKMDEIRKREKLPPME